MGEAMRGVAKAMFSMNKAMNVPAMQRVLMVREDYKKRERKRKRRRGRAGRKRKGEWEKEGR